jgi:hypothetical protein
MAARAVSQRRLTGAEWAELSPGLGGALSAAGVTPVIEARPHPAAYLARFRFGSVPIMAVGRTIWWPNARPSFAGTPHMAVLQHELQHLLDFAERRLSIAGYLLLPHNWTYRWDPDRPLRWDRLGAEQRASIAEALWRADRLGSTAEADRLRRVIPWAS